ncbi:hypothetical protein Cgig2_003804 [Carnegiea gigantea]|uniref:Uncharacterized protein n=1 Tax=Carnegiea gigantea TaxID=171969 RepID=A0A9Q1QDY8_9CARY|nr:hypothetical protein Cgig2_003804 [Carnegiea gigantea]
MPSTKNLQINGFTMILQVWFYEHSSIYAFADEKRIIPVTEVMDEERRIQAEEAFIQSEEYNAYVEDGVISMEKGLRRARDALRKEREVHAKEKEAHVAAKKELDELKEVVTLKTTMEDILEFTRMQRFNSSSDASGMRGLHEEGSNTDICSLEGRVQASPSSPLLESDVADTTTPGQSVLSAQMGLEPMEEEMFVGGEVGEVKGQSPCGD